MESVPDLIVQTLFEEKLTCMNQLGLVMVVNFLNTPHNQIFFHFFIVVLKLYAKSLYFSMKFFFMEAFLKELYVGDY